MTESDPARGFSVPPQVAHGEHASAVVEQGGPARPGFDRCCAPDADVEEHHVVRGLE
jgi:hypothetical protein